MNPTPANLSLPPNDETWSGGRTYLLQPGLRITDRWFVVAGQRYEVSKLRSPRTVRGAYDSTVATTAVIAGVVVLAAVVSVQVFYSQPIALLGIAVVALIPVGLAVAAWRLHPRPYELWADYRGVSVRLFRCPNERIYGHVARALMRAQESRWSEGRRDTMVYPPAA